MKKICYVTTISLTIRSFFIRQLQYLADNGYKVFVICSPDETLQEELGEKVTFLPVPIARGISPLTLLSSVLALKKVFKKEKFDIVQYSTPNAAFVSSVAAKIAGIKVRNYHLMGLRYLGTQGVLRFILKQLEKITCRFSTHIECVTNSNLRLSVDEKLFSPEKATVVWNGSSGGIDLERFDHRKRELFRARTREELGLSAHDFVFGFVGRITKDKGIDEILSAFSSVSRKSKLLLIGPKEGIDTLNLALWESAQNDKNIIICDSVSDVERYYAAIDVLLLPSYREGFGMVIAEAAAMGTPSIISNIPGPIDAVIENKTALTVQVKNVEDLKSKMELFLDTPALRVQMSEECVKFVKETFDSSILCEKILERKENLLA